MLFSRFLTSVYEKNEKSEQLFAAPISLSFQYVSGFLFHFERLTVNTFALCGVAFVSADHNLVKRTVIL